MTSAASADDLFAEEWLASIGVNDQALFLRRLAWDQLAPGQAAAAFNKSGSSSDPGLFKAIQEWLRASPPIADGIEVQSSSTAPFFELWACIATGAMEQLLASLSEDVAQCFGVIGQQERWRSRIYAALHRDLVSKLASIGEAVLWREFTLRRTPDQIVYAHLGDGTAGSRRIRRSIYCQLLEEMRADALHRLVKNYPVLRTHLCNTVEQWTKSSSDLFVRVQADLPELIEVFDLPRDVEIVDLTLSLSDPHRGGQTVAVLVFESGSHFTTQYRVVYKPKDLAIDKAFQDLLRELPLPGPDYGPLRSAVILTRPGYGYMEYLPHSLCSGDLQLSAFYGNAGRLTAILYVLGCTDCHHENLIACGDQLQLVDAETLLAGCFDYEPDDLNACVANSVTSLGILPQWHFVGTRRIARDVSALGIEPPEDKRHRVRGWTDLNTDAMVIGEREQLSSVPTSLPVGAGQPNRIGDFVSEFCTGFANELAAIAAQKARWLGETGYLKRFKGKSRRVVVRPTWIYLWLRQKQLEPDALRSPRQHRLVLEMLSRSYLRNSVKPRDWALFAAEVAQMEDLDVPYFEMSVSDTALTADGRVIDDFVTTSGYDNARRKVESLNHLTIEFQVQLVRGAIAAKSQPTGPPGQFDNPVSVLLGAPERPDALAEAELIGRHLLKASINYGVDATEWLGIDVLEDLEKFRFGPLGLSLYGGRIGVALFLAALSRQGLPESDDYRRLAIRALSDVPEKLCDVGIDDQRRWWRDQPLGLAGSGGTVLGLILLMELLPELDLRNGLFSLLEACDEDFLRKDQRLDVVFGVGGLIGPLLKLGSKRALHLAQTAGKVLLDCQDASGGWKTGTFGDVPLTGFSHGASGLAAAMAALQCLPGGSAYGEAVRRAVSYESTTFDPVRRNWPDVRGGRGRGFMLSWCNGAPGIALSRLCIASRTPLDPDTGAELEHALASTSDPTATPYVDSLCCGRFGRAVILRLASRCSNSMWLAAARALEHRALDLKQKRGQYASVHSPGLFCGLSGVGLALLEGMDNRLDLLTDVLSAGLYGRVADAAHTSTSG